MFRGKIGMHQINDFPNDGDLLIHTTNLRKNRIHNPTYSVKTKYSIFNGPGLLFPRVGQTNREKICLIRSTEKFALSDCVFGISTKNNEDADLLFKELMLNWNDFSKLYKGTGAKYTTKNKLVDYFCAE